MQHRRELRDYIDGETLFLLILALVVVVSGGFTLMEAEQQRKKELGQCPACKKEWAK